MSNSFKHLHGDIPQALADKMKELSDMVGEDIINTIHDACGELSHDVVQGVPVSGFIPFQDGGFSCSQLFPCEPGYSYKAFTKAQADFINDQDSHCFKQFLSDNGLDPELEREPEALENEYAQYQNDWHEPALLRFQVFAVLEKGRSLSQGVHIGIYVNYLDAPYYREKSDSPIFEELQLIEEFQNCDLSELVARIKSLVKGAN